jgi:hypothetical protein
VLRLSRLRPDWLFFTLLHRRIYGNAFVYILVTLNKFIVTSASTVTRRGNVLFSLLSDNCRRVSEKTSNMSQYFCCFLTRREILDIGLTALLPSERSLLRTFITLKNPFYWTRFKLANLGSSGKHAIVIVIVIPCIIISLCENKSM